MSALARTTEINCDTRAANEDCINGGSRTRTKYDYDALGRRASKTVTGLGTTTYLLDGDEEIAEYSGATVLRHYITGPGIDDRIAHAEGSTVTNPTKTYYHVNHQGSVMAMTDGSGNLSQRIGYDEYGNGSPATGEQFGYTGRRYDPETQLYYYRARYYAPAIGRFLQVDPVGYKDNLNLYTYTGNDPINKVDPYGKYSCGQSMDAPTCKNFTTAQNAAKAQIAAGMQTISGIQQALASGAKLTADQQTSVENIDKVLGSGAGTSAKALSGLLASGAQMLGVLNGNMPAEVRAGDTAYARAGAKSLDLYPAHFASSSQQQSENIAHESFHHATGLGDPHQIDEGEGAHVRTYYPYGINSLSHFAQHYSLDRMLQVPDAVTIALGVPRGDGP